MKRIFYFMMMVGLLAHAVVNVKASAEVRFHTGNSYVHDAGTQLRNFAFSRCVAISFADVESVSSDANAASAVYLAAGQIDEASVAGVDGFITQWLKKPYRGKHRGDLKLMRCIDIQQSPDMSKVPVESPVRSYDGAGQLFNFALARCLWYAFDNEDVRADSRAATTGYVEFGENGLEDYRHIGDLVKEWLQRPAPDPEETPSKLMACMDIYRGTDLHEIIALYTDDALEPLRSFAINYCLSIDKGFDQATRDIGKAQADALMASGRVSRDAQQRIVNLAKQWLEHSRPMPDEDCEGLYSSPTLLDAIKPYAGFVKQ